MEKITNCPVCGNTNHSPYLNGIDYFLTKQPFTIVACKECGFRFTNPRPDQFEIIPYYQTENYIAHDTSKGSLLESIYKFIRKIALANKFNIIKSFPGGKTILDIGCGTGEFLNYCKIKGYTAIGIEPNSKARTFAKEKYGLTVKEETYLSELPTASIDVITLWHVLEHVHLLPEYLERIFRLLKPEGTLLIALPNSNSWDANKYKQFWAAFDLPRHLYHFTPQSLKMLVEKNKFILNKTLPLKFDSYYISLLSEKYMSGHHNYIQAFINGLVSNFYAKSHQNNYSSLIYICKLTPGGK